MKKLLSLFLALALVFSLAACRPTNEATTLPTQDMAATTQETTQITQSAETSQPTEETELIVPPETRPEPQPTTQTTAPVQGTTPPATQTEPAQTQATTPPQTQATTPAQTEPPATQTTAPTQTDPPETQATEPPETTQDTAPETEATTEPETTAATEPLLDKNGSYTSKADVGLYIHLYGCLPPNFITKSQAKALGWKSGSLEPYAPGCCIGGDTFQNRERLLPSAPGRTYKECDIDTMGKSSRGAKRIVFSNDGLVYYTSDHYESFTLLYGEP